MRKEQNEPEGLPMLKNPEQMSKVCGIGVSTLRDLMDKGEIEFVQLGNRRLLADDAVWAWYDRNKTGINKEAN